MNLKLLIDSESFSQNFPIELRDFIGYCKDRDINVNEEILEYLEEKRLFFPIFRTSERFIEDTKKLKKLYSEGLLKEPKNEFFVSWDEFYIFNKKYGIKELSIYSYYSKYQIFHLIRILDFITLKFSLKDDDDIFLRDKKFREKNIDKILTQFVESQCQFCFFINYIQNKYLPFSKDSRYIMLININLKELMALTSLIDISKVSEKFSIDILKSIRMNFSIDGSKINPLKNWYHLVKYISYEKKMKLKGKALLAQDYYLVSDMLRLLIEDLTGEEQYETYSVLDETKGDWMHRIYGKKINYKDIDVLKIILTDYRINPEPDLLLIVEGHSEEAAIPIILNAYNETLEEYRIELYNAEGVDKKIDELMKYIGIPTVRKIDEKYHVSPFRTRIFGIFDKEGRFKFKKPDDITKKIMNDILKRLPIEINEETRDILLMDTIRIKVWNKCFEYDNLANEELIFLLEKYSKKYNHELKISESELEGYRQRNEDIKRLYIAKTGQNLNKKQFGELIGAFLADNVKNGKEDYDIIEVLNEVIFFSKGAKSN